MPQATTPEPKQRFVACGGWIKVDRSIKLKTRIAFGFAAAWFVGFVITILNVSQISGALWSVAGVGQICLISIAAALNVFETPIERETFIRNPHKQPHALY